jgi:hypothetical protein
MENNDFDDEDHPILFKRLRKQRTVFAPGSRMRMNIIPMFLAVFLPWVIYIVVSHINSFQIRHVRPAQCFALTSVFWIGWLFYVRFCIQSRRRHPEPTWYSYFALMIGFAVVFGTAFGNANYVKNMSQYYNEKDMKIINHLDPDLERGQNVLDAGLFYFADGTHVNTAHSWHFMAGTLYCVAPLSGMRGSPVTQTYDFWAVGKDCCSTSASDFQCGDWANPKARSGARVFDQDDIDHYRLAVEQTETLFDIMATNPVFILWQEDPLATILAWSRIGFSWWLKSVCAFFVFSLFCVVMATSQFAYIGRRESIYEQSITAAPPWAHTGADRAF